MCVYGPTDRSFPQFIPNPDQMLINTIAIGRSMVIGAAPDPVRPSIRTFVLVTMDRVYLFHLMIRKQPITLMAFNFDYYYS